MKSRPEPSPALTIAVGELICLRQTGFSDSVGKAPDAAPAPASSAAAQAKMKRCFMWEERGAEATGQRETALKRLKDTLPARAHKAELLRRESWRRTYGSTFTLKGAKTLSPFTCTWQ